MLLLIATMVLGLAACKPKADSETASEPKSVETSSKPSKAAEKSTKLVATPAATEAKATPSAKPTDEPEEADVDDTGLALKSAELFDSYRETTKMTSKEEGKAEEWWEITVEYERKTPAKRIVTRGSDNEGNVPETEMIQIGDTTYMNMGDEWIAMQQTGEDLVASEHSFWGDPGNFMGSGNCKFQGKDKIDGLTAKHYRCTDKLLFSKYQDPSGARINSGQIDTWVSTKYDVAIKTVVEWKGVTSEGDKVEFKMESQITDINKPINIEPPAGVTAPSVPEDVPIIEGAANLSLMGNIITYETTKSADDASSFYKAEMVAKGWKQESGMVPMMLQFTKGERSAQIMIAGEDQKTSVTIMISE